MIRHILVAVDGSEPSRKAARFAHDLSVQVNARLTLLMVLEPPRVLPIPGLDSYALLPPKHSNDELNAAARFLDEVAADLPKTTDKRVEVGTPAETICDRARELGADLVVVGARGHGRGRKWLVGSVSDRVVQHAGIPVTVVH